MIKGAWGGTGSPWLLIKGWLDSAPWRHPAPAGDRCIMGGPVGPAVHCRRNARGPGGLWCKRHDPDGRHIDSEKGYGLMADSPEFKWRERRWYTTTAPEGKCWSVREMLSYQTNLEHFIPHLQAMAEGLERPHFSEYDGDDDGEDNFGMFVVGLRPMTPEDKTREQIDAEWRERNEREQYERLKAKFEPGREMTDED